MEAQMTTVVLLIVIISSATAEVKNLAGTEGGSITLPDPVKFGFFLFKGTIIAMVENGQIRILKTIFNGRLFWNETTGLFTVRGLQRNDSGIYTIDAQNFTASYQLKVYESIQTPAVTTLNVSAESCTLLCLVEKAEETTLSWYKDEDVVNHSSSALPLPYTVDKQHFNSSYRCVAANPAEEKTLPVNVHTSCSEQDATDNRGNTDSWGRRHYIIVICVVLTVIVVLVAFIIKYKYLDKTKRTTMHTQGRCSELRRAVY
ncbi:signaling lymphocytic activation molecule-like isoform X2 [Pempheris klunzingeri]|uniref:signaling lymphocytic activation molecule-like isoform X2 n=1 Tax=Pempheris klunzingeri TaxID=3127111 RepID=UPI003980E59E